METLLRLLALATFAGLTACAPASPPDDDGDAVEHDDVALDDAYATELWAPPVLAANAPYTPLRLVTQDPELAGARLVVTTDRPVGLVSPSGSSRSREVDGWFYGTSGPGFSLHPGEGDAGAFGPLTFSVRRADAPDLVIATAETELVPATDHPSADACLGGGNVVVWEHLASYAGATGPMVESLLAGDFAAVQADVDYWPAENAFRRYGVRVGSSWFEVHGPVFEDLAIGETVSADVRFPGRCATFRGEAVVLDLALGAQLSSLRRRIDRITMAWRGACGGTVPVALRGCAHFDVDSPVLR